MRLTTQRAYRCLLPDVYWSRLAGLSLMSVRLMMRPVREPVVRAAPPGRPQG